MPTASSSPRVPPSAAAGPTPGETAGRQPARHLGRAVLVLLAVADAGWIATTRPFAGASAGVAVLAGGLVVLVPAAAAFKGRPARPGAIGRLRRGQPVTARHPSIAPWLAVAAVIVAYELVTLALGAGDRRAFPTVSSLYDAAARLRPAKAALALLWLGLGAALFRR